MVIPLMPDDLRPQIELAHQHGVLLLCRSDIEAVKKPYATGRIQGQHTPLK